MKKLTAAALLAIALGAIIHIWPADPASTDRSEPRSAPFRDAPAATAGSPTPAPQSGTAQLPERATPARGLERPAVAPVQIAVNAPQTVRAGETFPVTIELQAREGIRQLAFSVVYKKSILKLVGSSPGTFTRQGGPSVQFEEVSDGSVLVRIGLEGGVLAGAGSVAVIEFQALKRGVSPVAIHGVSYFGDGNPTESNTPTAYEGSITVE
jgi:hypothetical protein